MTDSTLDVSAESDVLKCDHLGHERDETRHPIKSHVTQTYPATWTGSVPVILRIEDSDAQGVAIGE